MALKKCKECGHQVSKKAETCPSCGNKLKSKWKLQTVGCLFWIVVFFMGVSWISSWEAPESQPWDQTDNWSMAYIQMESFVEDRLVSPSTAEFPGVFDGKKDHVTKNGTTYTIRSYVDAQNRMGGTVRMYFEGVIEQVDESTWRLKSLKLDE